MDVTDKSVGLWDAANGRAIGQPIEHQGRVFDAAIAPDGRSVLTAASDNAARLWEERADESDYLSVLDHGGVVAAMAMSPDGRHVLTGGEGRARLWDAGTEKPAGGPMRLDGGFNAIVAFSPDGRIALTAGIDGAVRLLGPRIPEPRPALAPGQDMAAIGADRHRGDDTAVVEDGQVITLVGPLLPESRGVVRCRRQHRTTIRGDRGVEDSPLVLDRLADGPPIGGSQRPTDLSVTSIRSDPPSAAKARSRVPNSISDQFADQLPVGGIPEPGLPSPPTVNRTPPSGETPDRLIPPGWVSSSSIGSPVASQRWDTPSSQIVNTPGMPGRGRTSMTGRRCGIGLPAGSPVAASQSCAVRSSPAVSTTRPSGENRAASTRPWCGIGFAGRLARGRVPEPRHLVVAGGEHDAAVRAESGREHPALVRHRLAGRLARGRVPEPRRPVTYDGVHDAAVRGESGREHPALVRHRLAGRLARKTRAAPWSGRRRR